MRPSLILRAKGISQAIEDARARMPQASYYKRNQMSPALLRARQQYLIPNIITGTCIFSFAIGVFAFTLRAVGQDEFEDVPIPDAPQQPATAPNASVNRSGGVSSAGT